MGQFMKPFLPMIIALSLMAGVVADASAASCSYDGRGWCKSRTVNGTATISVTDTDNREMLEYDGSTGAILRWYAYGLGPNDVLSQMDVPDGIRFLFLPDIQGSVIATANSAGILAKSTYEPYGVSGSGEPPVKTSFAVRLREAFMSRMQ